jgi:processive 1,2-diacylglycerol beta-glucosyltransferase
VSPRILVVYVTAGAGHRRAAQALACALTAAFPYGAIECQDLLGHVPRWLQHTYPSVYDAFVRYLSPLWGVIFSSLDRLPVYACLQPLRRRWNWRMARSWVRRLQDDPPTASSPPTSFRPM